MAQATPDLAIEREPLIYNDPGAATSPTFPVTSIFLNGRIRTVLEACVNYYIAPGTRRNWESSFKGNIWGLPDWHMPSWKRLKIGDTVFFYVLSPISAVVGYGQIQDKFASEEPFLAQDSRQETDWPWRFNFEIILPSTDPLESGRVYVGDLFKFPRLKRFEELESSQGLELLRRCHAEYAPGCLNVHETP
jgi:hypothetical protein